MSNRWLRRYPLLRMASLVVGMQGVSVGAIPAAAEVVPVGSEFQVNTHTPDGQQRPAVAANADGDFVVAWRSIGQDGSFDGIFAQRFASDGTAQGSEFQVNTYTTSYQRFPALSADANGDFVVAWESGGQDGSFTGVFAQRYVLATVTPTFTPTSTPTITPTATPTPTAGTTSPEVRSGCEPGAAQCCGVANPDLPDDCLQIIDVASGESIGECSNPNGGGATDAEGNFCCDTEPVRDGSVVRVDDVCTPLNGTPFFIGAAAAPTTSRVGLLIGLGVLLAAGWTALGRGRRTFA
jgi:hypothetical protein